MSAVPFRRNRYFEGKLLTSLDLQLEQSYFREKQKLRNRCVHGAGVLCGLRCRVSGDGGAIEIEPGVALDCEGNEIVVPSTQRIEVADRLGERYVCLEYVEREASPGPVCGRGSGGDGIENGYIEESFDVELRGDSPVTGHAESGCGWAACGGHHGIPLARLLTCDGLELLSATRGG